MERKNVNQKHNERPNEEEHADQGGLKSETKVQGPKPDPVKKTDNDDADDEIEESDE